MAAIMSEASDQHVVPQATPTPRNEESGKTEILPGPLITQTIKAGKICEAYVEAFKALKNIEILLVQASKAVSSAQEALEAGGSGSKEVRFGAVEQAARARMQIFERFEEVHEEFNECESAVEEVWGEFAGILNGAGRGGDLQESLRDLMGWRKGR